jgi:RNA polymerase sigma factor (sigma-70 family)
MTAVAPTMSPDAQADAARLLYARYYPNVYRYALSQLRSAEDAEDAAQNTFLRAFASLQKGTVPQNELAWLFKIAHNVCASSKLAWLRRRRVEAPRDLTALHIEPSSPETRRDELAGLEDALATMPPRPREAFLLREMQGLSYAEIAERLDTSQSAVETLIFRARKMLAEKLERPLQRVRQALGLGPLLDLARGIFGTAPAAVKAAGAIAVVAGASVATAPHPTLSRPAPAMPARVMAPPARMSRPGPQRAARQRTLAPAAPHSVAVQRPRTPLAPGAVQSTPATPTPTTASKAAPTQSPPTRTTPPATPVPALPAPPVSAPAPPITTSSPPAVLLPEIPAAVSVTAPSPPPAPPVTVPVPLPVPFP